ncbi:MAG TPA: MG2 domain-containing protein [Chitinophagaceae bacterium]|nr:MG2 domain-containing protein [Chitinophagaceae bacterium]
MQFKRTFLSCLLLLMGAIVNAQNDAVVQNLQQQFNSSSRGVIQEKVFVHTDKDFFVAGEIVWFKVYTVDASANTPSTISKVAYVEVTDADKKPVMQAKISLTGGSGSGSFQLPTSVKSGNYVIRAYTNWMKNFSADLYFTRQVTIVNTFRDLEQKQQADSPGYEIRFFPEGGNLVAGNESKVAFRIIDQNGRGIECSGKVVDQEGRTIVTFSPQKFGIGNFMLTPVTGGKYSAVISIGGKTISRALPDVNNQGYILRLNDAGSQVNINVSSTEGYQAVYLLVNTGLNLKKVLSKQLQDGKTVFTVDKNTLGDGINHFTLFNNQAVPVCERLYFKRPVQKLAIDITTDQQEYNERKKASISINVKDENNATQVADMSMAVYRVDSLQAIPAQNIMSYLLLNAELRGTIESPGYYINNNNDDAADAALDNLMLTHGWSRFKWENITQNKAAADYLPEYEGHIVMAKITDKKTGQPAPGIEAYLSVPGKNYRLAIARSDNNGVLRFNVRNFIGGDEIIVQTDQQKDSIFRIDIMNPFSDKYGTFLPAGFTLSKNMENLLVQHSINTQVQNVYSGEKSRQFYAADIDTLPFYGVASKKYMLDDYVRFTTMEEVLREYVAEVAVRRQHGNFVLKVSDDPHNILFENNPLVMVDGVPFFNMDSVIAFNPLKINKLEVVTHKYYYGPAVIFGIVSYSTYKGDLDGIPLDPASLVLEYNGMQLQREFYCPKYDTPQTINSKLPDFRDVLYWQPNLKTDVTTGSAKAMFYTSDLPGTYAVVVQGITAAGKMGSTVRFITVK